MAYTFLSGKEIVVVLDSGVALVVAETVLLVVPVANFLPPDVGCHFDGEPFSGEGHD